MKKLFILVLIAAQFTSCTHKVWVITQATSTKIAIDSTTDKYANKDYEAYLKPLKQEVDAEMNVVIGHAAEAMSAYAPESLLSNFSADVYKKAASEFLNEDVDISIVNMGGLRTTIAGGDIRIGKIFEIMPFENELVILWIKGDQLLELIQYFARAGGEGESGIRMTINNGKAENVSVNGEMIDFDKLYSIATNDYLAGGNDKMTQLAQYVKRINTGLKVRNVLIDYITAETKKGNLIQSKLDGRITISPQL